MSFCDPQNIEDFYKTAPVVAKPATDAHPNAPARPSLPETAIDDSTYAGSLKSAEEQLAKAEAALAKALEEERQGTIYGSAGTLAMAVTSATDAMRTDVDKARLWLTNLKATYDKAINDAKYAGYSTSTAYGSFVTPSLDIYNRLYKQRLALEDVDGALTTAYGMAANIGEKYLGMKPEDVAALKEFKKTNFDPLISGLRGFRDYGGQVDVFVTGSELVNGFERWLGPENGLVYNMKRFKNFVTELNTSVEIASEMLKYATDLLQASQRILMAACTLLHAMKQFIENIGWMLLNLPFLLTTLLANLIPTRPLWFKLPQSIELLLTRVDGLRAKLAGFDEVGRCYETLLLSDGEFSAGDSAPGATKSIAPESVSGAVNEFMGKVSLMATESVAAGIAQLVLLLPQALIIPNPLDPARATWEARLGLSGMPSPRPVILPEEGALLSFLSGAGMVVGFVSSLFGQFLKPGAGPVDQESLYVNGVDASGQASNVPLVPHPVMTIYSSVKAARQGLSQAKAAFAQAESLTRAAEAAKASARARTEAEYRAALAAWVAELEAGVASANLAVDPTLSNPTQVTLNKLACRASSIRDDNGKTLPTQEEVEAEAAKLAGAHDALYNSVTDIASRHRPAATGSAVSARQVVNGLPASALPEAHTSNSEHQALLAGYTRVENSYDDIENLPLLLLLQSREERDSLAELQYIANKIETINTDVSYREAHLSLLQKAIDQGRNSNSPYTWLAKGLDLTSGYTHVMQMIKHFLRHNKASDIQPFARWLENSSQDVDFETPIPTGLSEIEAAAAQESYFYLQTRAAATLTASALIVTLRRRADELGFDLGYEYIVAIALLMVLKKLKAAFVENASVSQIQEIAGQSEALLEYLTHADMFKAMIQGLTGEISQ